MSKIYEQNFFYRLIKPCVSYAFKCFYGKYIVVGRENIPENGPVIFAPNHRNALMDALAIVSITPNKYSTSFLARADIFRKSKVAKMLNFAKIMPAFRIRDGYENLGRNNQTFDLSSELLVNGNALCIMPEGNQETEQRIRPLVKGIFRIAFATQEKCGLDTPVLIIPVGLDYGSIFKYGKHIIISIGKPVDMTEYLQMYFENQAQAMNELRERLTNELKNLTVDIESVDNYQEILIASELAGVEISHKHSVLQSFKQRQAAAQKLLVKEKNDSDGFKNFAENCRNFSQHLKKLNLKSDILFSKVPSLTMLVVDAILLLITFPVFLQGLLFNFIPFFLPVFLRKRVFKPQFDGFFSSLHFALGLVVFPIYYIILTVSIIFLSIVPWWVVIVFIPAQYVVGKWAYSWYKEFRKYQARIRYYRFRNSDNEMLNNAIRTKDAILKYIHY